MHGYAHLGSAIQMDRDYFGCVLGVYLDGYQNARGFSMVFYFINKNVWELISVPVKLLDNLCINPVILKFSLLSLKRGF